MALLGRAVMINWSDVPVEHRAEYYAWHDREHMAGRLRVAGFQRGRRHLALDADRDVFNLYEVDDLSVLTGGAYAKLTEQPSEASRRVGKLIVNAVRALAQVEFTTGTGVGAYVHTLRFDAAEGQGAALMPWLRGRLSEIAAVDGAVAAHLCVADREASSAVTPERRGRPTSVPYWSVIIEGISADAVRSAGALLDERTLAAKGAAAPVARGTYALQRLVARADVA